MQQPLEKFLACIYYLALRSRIAHPLNNLPARHEVDVLPADHLLEEFAECASILLVLEPGRVEVKAQRGAI